MSIQFKNNIPLNSEDNNYDTIEKQLEKAVTNNNNTIQNLYKKFNNYPFIKNEESGTITASSGVICSFEDFCKFYQVWGEKE